MRLNEAGAQTSGIGSGSSATFHSKHSYEVRVDAGADTVSPEQFDGVVIPGGWAPDRLRRYPAVVNLVRQVFEQGKIVAAICHGGSVLVSAKVLKGRKVTCAIAIKDDVICAG